MRPKIQEALARDAVGAHVAIVTVTTSRGARECSCTWTRGGWEIHGNLRHNDGTPWDGDVAVTYAK